MITALNSDLPTVNVAAALLAETDGEVAAAPVLAGCVPHDCPDVVLAGCAG